MSLELPVLSLYRNSLNSHYIYSLKALTQDMERLKNVSFSDLSQCQCECVIVTFKHCLLCNQITRSFSP